jgi:hypothetical protein
MTSMRIPVGLAAALAALVMLAPGPATAACFENGVGCTNTGLMPTWALRQLSCDALWTVRNTIYYENGYCFKTSRGIAAFGNNGCSFSDMGMVPLNTYERNNVGRVVKVEKEKGCR